MLEPNYSKRRPPVNAGTRIIENGDLPVGWLDACFCYFVKRCYRTSLTSKSRSTLNVPWCILCVFPSFSRIQLRCVKAAIHIRRQVAANDVAATRRIDKWLRVHWRTFVKIFVVVTSRTCKFSCGVKDFPVHKKRFGAAGETCRHNVLLQFVA